MRKQIMYTRLNSKEIHPSSWQTRQKHSLQKSPVGFSPERNQIGYYNDIHTSIGYLAWLSILQKLEIHSVAIGHFWPNLCNHVEEDSNRMAPTNCIAILFEVVSEAWSIEALNQIHASMVKSLGNKKLDKVSSFIIHWKSHNQLLSYLDRLINLSSRWVIVSVVEAITPMAEVWGDHKADGRILEFKIEKKPTWEIWYL